ncbi:MAG: 6-hydroxymethylpterin diphosphokinase MptE-like protein [Spirochaetaceae bacterium]
MPVDDLPRVVKSPGGRSVIYGTKHLYNPSAPVVRARARAGGAATAESTFYILASPLLWHGVEELLLSLPASSHIAAVELDGNLQRISLEELPLPQLESNSRLHILRGENTENSVRSKLLTLLYNLGIEKFRRAVLIHLNGGYRLNARGYTRIQQFLEEEIRSFWKNKMTLIHMAPLWIKNIFYNTALYHRHIHGTAPPADTPVLVVGAGPSAEKIVPLLRREELRSRITIIAVDTALAPLMETGVQPDAVVIQEGQFYNVYDFIPLPAVDAGKDEAEGNKAGADDAGADEAGSASAPFYWMDLISAHIIPRLRKEPEKLLEGSLGFFITEFFPTRLFGRLAKHSLLPPAVAPLGSVGSTAVELALRRFSGPIYVCGLDFSLYYGKSHMRGATLTLRELLISGRLHPAGSSPVLFPAKSVYSSGSSARPGGPKKITTGTLLTYSETFRNRFSSSKRLFAIAPSEADSTTSFGADLGIPTISIDDFWRHLLGPERRTGHSRNHSAPRSAYSPESGGQLCSEHIEDTRERARAFLKEEINLLRRLYAEGVRRLSGEPANTAAAKDAQLKDVPAKDAQSGAEGSHTQESPKREALSLEEMVKEADYLLHHFPDTGYGIPEPLTPGMIKRLLVSTGHYLKIIKRALTLLEVTPDRS